MRSRGVYAGLVAGLFLIEPASSQGDKSDVEALQLVERRELARVGTMILEARVLRTSLGKPEITTLTVPAANYSFGLAMNSMSSSDGSSLSRFRLDEKAVAAFTGGFLETYSPARPAGLVQRRGAVLNDIQDDRVMKAVVCYSADGATPVTIMDAHEFVKDRTRGDCIQTGPFLVRNGKEATDFSALDESLPGRFPFSRKPFQRAFLLLDGRGAIVVGVASSISLFALRDLLLKPVQEGGFAARTAVALSGTRTAGLVVELKGKELGFGSTQTLLPNAVVIEER